MLTAVGGRGVAFALAGALTLSGLPHISNAQIATTSPAPMGMAAVSALHIRENLPGRIANDRRHPRDTAISAGSRLGLPTFVLRPVALMRGLPDAEDFPPHSEAAPDAHAVGQEGVAARAAIGAQGIGTNCSDHELGSLHSDPLRG